MSHSFSITANEGEINEKRAYFHGYADGMFYRAFNATEFNQFWSGAFNGKQINYLEAKKGLDSIVNSEIAKNYPGQGRFDAMKKFLEEMYADDVSTSYFVFYF